MIRLLLALVAALGLWASAALAQAVSDADRTEFQRIISSQIKAFEADDGAAAYAFASPGIKRAFPTPDVFMSMVRKGYQPVYRPKSFAFGETETEPSGRPSQQVTIVDAEGRSWTAYYAFERQPDGSWLISGCVLRRIEGADV
jgi:hypothetical protein